MGRGAGLRGQESRGGETLCPRRPARPHTIRKIRTGAFARCRYEPMSDTVEPPPPIATPEETHVEIHKVKPIHTWRDFLKELGTIVLGIIIAISLEHLVQS